MKVRRMQGIAIGILFLSATATYLSGSELIASALTDSVNASQLKLGAFLEFINSAVVVAIAALLYPILEKYGKGVMLGYVSSRIVEAILLLAATACAMLPLVAPGLPTDMLEAFMGLRAVLFQLAMISLGMGSVFLCWTLYTSRLLPRLLSVLGIIGYIGLFLSGWLELFNPSPLSMAFYIPGALFEIAFPIWLFSKGFQRRNK